MGINDVIKGLESSEKIMILSHHNADVDSVCPSFVLKKALISKGKNADIGAAESVSKSIRNLVEDVKINPKLDNYDTIITVDCASPEQLDPIELKGKLIVIDHHSPGKLKEMADYEYVVPEAQTCTQLVMDIVDALDYDMDGEDASLMIAGIVGDTNYLSLATPDIFRRVANLLEKSEKSYSEVLNSMRTVPDISEKIAFIKSLKRLKTYQIDNILVATTTAGSFEAPIARNLVKTGIDIAIVATPKKNNLRISSRMNWKLRDKINLANEVFHPLEEMIGGSAGGHDAAASANGKNSEKVNEILTEMVNLIEKKLGKSKGIS